MPITDKLNKWVTVFSPMLKKGEHGSPLTVGGEITSIDVFNFEEKEDNADAACFLILDDGVGEITVMLPNDIYKDNEENIKLSNILVIEGRLFMLKDQADNKETKVVGYSVEKIDI